MIVQLRLELRSVTRLLPTIYRWLSLIIGSDKWRRSLGRACRSVVAKVWLLITSWRRNIFAKLYRSWVRRQFAKILWNIAVGKLAHCIFESTRNQPKGNIHKGKMKCAPVELLMNETPKRRWWEQLSLYFAWRNSQRSQPPSFYRICFVSKLPLICSAVVS